VIKTLKWIYKLGVMAERRRIKLLIAEHRNSKPELSTQADKIDGSISNYQRQIDLWYSVEAELSKLTEPNWNIAEQQFTPPTARIDE